MGTIMIPKKCKAGFQERADTCYGKLSYIIYYDEKNVLRKESSWESWRDKKIKPVDFANIPSSGFFIDKKVGGGRYSWNPRQTYCRVYDSRGFEFEITITNLIYILKNTNSSKDKGFEGEFVYGWDGKDLVLVPTEAPEYQDIKIKTAAVYDKGHIEAKSLVAGYTYGDLNDNQFIYLTKAYKYIYRYVYEESYRYRGSNDKDLYNVPGMTKEEYDKLPISAEDPKYKILITKSNKKVFWFYDVKKKQTLSFNSLDKKLYFVLNDTVPENLSDYYDVLCRNKEYSKIDYSKDKLVYYTFEEFVNRITSSIDKGNAWEYFYNDVGKGQELRLDKDHFSVSDTQSQNLSYTTENLQIAYDIIKPLKCNIHTLENNFIYEHIIR